jgi:hypothetical protein
MQKKIIKRFIPVLIVGKGDGIFEHPLQPQETERKAEELIEKELIKQQPGCMAEIRSCYVVVQEEGIILPEKHGKLVVIQ